MACFIFDQLTDEAGVKHGEWRGEGWGVRGRGEGEGWGVRGEGGRNII